MPRQRTDHSRIVYALPDDFPKRLKQFQEESGLSRAEIAPPHWDQSLHRMALA